MPRLIRFVLSCVAGLLTLALPARAEVIENTAYTGSKTTIRWAFWGGEETVTLFRRIGRGFVARHPEIAVDIVIYPWGQYWQKLQTQAASGLAPDVLSIYSSTAGIWINHGALRPLDDLIARSDVARSDFYPGAVDNFRWEGQQYALPIEMAVYALVYSIDRLEERGLPRSRWPRADSSMTWEAFKALMRELTLRDGQGNIVQYGMGNGFLDWNSSLIGLYGGDFLDRRVNPTRPTVAGNTALARGLIEMWQVQYAERLMTPRSVFVNAEYGGDNILRSTQFATAYLGPWVLPNLQRAGIRFGVTPIPHGPVPTQTLSVNGVGIFKDSAHPEEAWAFIRYLTSVEAQSVIGATLRGVPALRAAAPALVDNEYGISGLEAFLAYLDRAEPVRTASSTYVEKAIATWQERVDALFDRAYEQKLRALQARGATLDDAAYAAYVDTMRAFVARTVAAQLPSLEAGLDEAFARTRRPPAGAWRLRWVPLLLVLAVALALAGYLRYVRRQERAAPPAQGRMANRAAYLCLSPWLIGFVCFTVGPIVASIVLSFTEWNMIGSPRWVGAQHYAELFSDRYFLLGIRKTFFYAALVIPISTIGGILTAGLLTSSVRGADSFKAIFYFPSLFTGAAAAVLWVNMFHKEYGVINRLVEAFGGLPVNWLDEQHAFYTVVLMNVFWIGGATIIYYAGMKQIPRSLYEAAELDGAGVLRRFTAITLPLLSPVILFMVVMTTIGAFQVFTPALFFVNYPSEIGGPGNALRFYAVNIYDEAFNNLHMGKACAWAFVLFLIIFAVTVLQLKLSKRFVYSDVEG